MRRTLDVVGLLAALATVPGFAQAVATAGAPPPLLNAPGSCQLLREADIASVLGLKVATWAEIPTGAGRVCRYFADSAAERAFLEVAVTEFQTVKMATDVYRHHERQFLKDKPLEATLDTLNGLPAIAYRAEGDRDRAARVIRKGTRLIVVHILPSAGPAAGAAKVSALTQAAVRRLS